MIFQKLLSVSSLIFLMLNYLHTFQIQAASDCLGRPYHFKFFKGCLPQILLGPFLIR